MPSEPTPPAKDYIDCITDSRIWSAYRPRPGDVVVATPPKSGTTWTQAILALLISGDPLVNAEPSVKSPWFDNKLHDLDELLDRLEAQTHKRHVKTHTPLDGIRIWNEIRYIAVYRHPIDVHFSYRRHIANYRPEAADLVGLDRDLFPDDPRESFRIFLDGDHFEEASLSAIVDHFKCTLDKEPRDNLLRLHYADMKRDLAGAVQAIARHIDAVHPPDVMKRLVEAATFENMKANADRFALAAGKKFWRDDAGFFHSGTSNKWTGVLSEEDLEAYGRLISARLSPQERSWLEWGNVALPDTGIDAESLA